MKRLFELGRIVATPGALDAMECAGVLPRKLLALHSEVVDILGLCDNFPFQGVSSLSMGSVTPHV